MQRKLNQRGETIVEVLIAVMVLSAALGGAFAISNRSQKTVQSNQERYQAQLIANNQADLIKLAQSDDGVGGAKASIDTRVTGNTNFCIPANASLAVNDTGTNCEFPYGSAFNYDVTVDPSSSGSDQTFVITVEWDSISANGGKDRVQLLYGL